MVPAELTSTLQQPPNREWFAAGRLKDAICDVFKDGRRFGERECIVFTFFPVHALARFAPHSRPSPTSKRHWCECRPHLSKSKGEKRTETSVFPRESKALKGLEFGLLQVPGRVGTRARDGQSGRSFNFSFQLDS